MNLEETFIAFLDWNKRAPKNAYKKIQLSNRGIDGLNFFGSDKEIVFKNAIVRELRYSEQTLQKHEIYEYTLNDSVCSGTNHNIGFQEVSIQTNCERDLSYIESDTEMLKLAKKHGIDIQLDYSKKYRITITNLRPEEQLIYFDPACYNNGIEFHLFKLGDGC